MPSPESSKTAMQTEFKAAIILKQVNDFWLVTNVDKEPQYKELGVNVLTASQSHTLLESIDNVVNAIQFGENSDGTNLDIALDVLNAFRIQFAQELEELLKDRASGSISRPMPGGSLARGFFSSWQDVQNLCQKLRTLVHIAKECKKDHERFHPILSIIQDNVFVPLIEGVEAIERPRAPEYSFPDERLPQYTASQHTALPPLDLSSYLTGLDLEELRLVMTSPLLVNDRTTLPSLDEAGFHPLFLPRPRSSTFISQTPDFFSGVPLSSAGGFSSGPLNDMSAASEGSERLSPRPASSAV